MDVGCLAWFSFFLWLRVGGRSSSSSDCRGVEHGATTAAALVGVLLPDWRLLMNFEVRVAGWTAVVAQPSGSISGLSSHVGSILFTGT